MTRIAIILYLLLPVTLACQSTYTHDRSADARFTEALRLFQSGELIRALAVFDSLRDTTNIHQKTTAAWIMAGKSLNRLGQYRTSLAVMSGFLRKFPESAYAADARYTLAVDYMMLQDYHDAALQLLKSVDTGSAPGLFRRSTELFRSVARNHLSATELREILGSRTTSLTRDLATITLAEKLYSTGRSEDIGTMLDEIANRIPPGYYSGEAAELSVKIKKGVKQAIGIVLPLSQTSVDEQVRTVANDILGGITAALQNDHVVNRSGGTPDYIVKDTRLDSAATVDAVRSLAGNPNIIAIIGPLFSNLAFISAPMADKAGMPLITPTAASDGIAAAGPNIFQVTPDYTTRGRVMAQYAVRDLGYTTLAVLGAGDPNARAMAQGFIREARRLGATIVTEQTFTPGATDLRDQFIALRTEGFRLEGNEGSPENLDIPLTAVGGVFFPLSGPQDIGVVASQMRYFNIQTQILGSNEWFDESQLDQQKRYVNGAIFLSDWYIDSADRRTEAFRQSYRSRTGKDATPYTLLGYDVMRLVLDKIAEGATTRDKLRTSLAAVRRYKGMYSDITFTGGRTNTVLQVLKYADGEITRLREASLDH